VEAWSLRGDCYLKRGQWAKAVPDFSEAIRLKLREGWYWHERAFAHLMLGEYAKSVVDHSRAIELRPDDPGQWARRGQAYQGLGKMHNAKADYSRAIKLNPGDGQLWHRRGQAHAELGEWDKAGADCAKAVELRPGDMHLRCELALLHLANGDAKAFRAARAALLKQVAAGEHEFTAISVAWTCCLAPGPADGLAPLVALAEKAVRGDPRSSHLITLGAALYRAGRFKEAIQRLNEASAAWERAATIPTMYSPAPMWFFLAMAHQRSGHAQESRRWLDKATKLMEKESQNPRSEASRSWNRRLTLRLLRREAENLLNRKKNG
jgi:tetratricopeptide (TPR) repeat protein